MQLDKPFILHAEASVEYSGRAKSKLPKGHYIIIHKSDGTLLIHGATGVKAINYQGAGATLSMSETGELCSIRKKEKILINIHKIINHYEVTDWTDGVIAMDMTESSLRDHIIANISQYIHGKLTIHTEYATPVGNIDILAVDEENVHHIIETKRGKAGLPGATQLNRYVEHFEGIVANGYIMSPTISKSALNYLTARGLKFVRVDHQIA